MSASMKTCCGLCPFSKKDTLFVHPDRAEEFAYSTENPYNDFVCHKTGVEYESDDFNDEMDGAIVRGEKSLKCKGFESMQYFNNMDMFPDDYKPDLTAFEDAWDMIERHQIKYDEDREVSTK